MRKSHQFFSRQLAKQQDGVALVVVLAMLVLLTGVVVAYLSRSNMDLKISTSSMAQSKAELLSRSATELVIAELQDEIIKKSETPSLNGGFYLPRTAVDMVLGRLLRIDGVNATEAQMDAFPNLLRISRRALTSTEADTMVSPGSSIPTTAQSLNKRSISTKRWNAHYLLPPVAPTDATPKGTFPVPHWVLMTTDGPKWLATLNSSSAKSVIGRYAYAIYNEGGLLDINVAGYPSTAADPDTLSSGKDTAGGKNSPAYADLTQLPAGTDTALTQTQVDKIVGWRNKGSINATGGINSGYTFPPAGDGTEPFHEEVVLHEASGYSKVKYDEDQRFISRQSLIKFWERSALNKEALQYITSYSRSLEQPSLLANGSTIPGGATPANPSVVSLKDSSGRPFVLKRFPMRRLAWLTPEGGSSSAAAGIFRNQLKAAGFTEEELDKGTTGANGNIEKSFGLTWGGNGWSYSDNHILTMSELQTSNRQPNFFELLKAAIPEGALRMGAAASTGSDAYHVEQRTRDENMDRAIFQIGANIIDQYDPDSYPTRITYTPATAPAITVAGVENLPYIYGTRQGIVQMVAPDSSVTITSTAAPAPVVGTVANEGKVASMLFPILWNPHTQTASNPLQTSGFIPNVRFVASSDHPLGNGTGGVVTPTSDSDTATKVGLGAAVTPDSSEMTIALGLGAFANPVILNEEISNGPATVGANHELRKAAYGGDGSLTPLGIAGTTSKVIGVVLGTSPLQWETATPNPSTVHTAKKVHVNMTAASIDTDRAIVMRMEYEGPGGWVPYDEKFAPVFGSQDIVDWMDWDKGLRSNHANWSLALDPRPSLFGMYVSNVGGAPADNIPADNSIDLAGSAYKGVHGWHGTVLTPWKLAINSGANAVADRDGITRQGMAGQVVETDLLNNPMAAASSSARPYILNRAFNSVAELGYVFSGTPWRNLDMTSSSSGYSRLLDVFCLNEVNEGQFDEPIVVGKVDLNTRQVPVIQALLAGSFRNADDKALALKDDTSVVPPVQKKIAKGLVDWTKTRPLIERSDLVSRYTGTYTGFASMIESLLGGTSAEDDIPYARFREASVRALANNGQTRVWNLMVDLVVQTGRYGSAQTDFAKFTVEGERRVWVHLAIDRFTGKVIDQQVEVVTE